MYTVIVYGSIETWERTFYSYYPAYDYMQKNKSKGFDVEMVEAYY